MIGVYEQDLTAATQQFCLISHCFTSDATFFTKSTSHALYARRGNIQLKGLWGVASPAIV